MRKELLLLLVSFYSAMLTAATVSQEVASQKALAFVNGRAAANARGRQVPRQLQVALATADYYVFNVGADGGFVIVSGDDSVTDILGYADSGSFDEANMPANMRAWLQGYADEIGRARELPTTTPQRTVRRSITPLIETHWDQEWPYNSLCPQFLGTGNTCVTGCVATAMAQLMYYHKWPAAVAAEIPAYSCATAWSGYGRINVKGVAAGTPIHWDDMLPVYPAFERSQQKEILTAQEQAATQAVAELMAYCGRAVRMDYRDVANHGSTASLYSVVDALVKYFDYDAATEYVTRTHYSSVQWEELIYGELEAGRPVFYGGSSVASGHAFIVDGFEDGYFHVNWGWGGGQDCYVLLSVMNPYSNSGIGASASGDGYSIGQGAIIHAQKNTGTEVPPSAVLETYNISTTGGYQLKRSWDGNFKVGISLSALNGAGMTNTFDVGIGVFDSEGTMLYVLPLAMGCELGGGVAIQNLVGRLSFGKDWKDGIYIIAGVSGLSTASGWSLNQHSDKMLFVASISGDQLQLIEPTVSLEANFMTVTGEQKTHSMMHLLANIQNYGTGFNDYLYLLANGEAKAGKIFEVGYEGSALLDIEFMIAAPGVYTLQIATDKEGTEVIGTLADVAIVGDGASETSDNAELTFTTKLNSLVSGTGRYILGNKLRATVTAVNDTDEDYYGKCTLMHYTWEGGSASGRGVYKPLIVKAHSSADVTFDYDVAIDGVYSVALAYQRKGDMVWYEREATAYDQYVAKPAVTVIDQEGVETYELATASYTVPERAQVLDLRGQAEVLAVIPNDNPNCLYLLDVDDTVPEGLVKNVVKGQTAELIELEDDGVHGFYSPVAFTADRIAYRRTFTQGLTEQGEGWSTIVLPFDVTEVEADGRRIDWFHSGTDSGKDFWLYAFSNDDLSSVGFVHAEELEADIPYIVSVPGKSWGEAYDLVGTQLTFKGENASIRSTVHSIMRGNYYRFCGTMKPRTVADAFVINADGTDFVKDSLAYVQPFRSYFTEVAGSTAVSTLGIVINDETATAVSQQPVTEGTADAVYNLQGVKVGRRDQLDRMPKGLYVVNGRKIINAK